MTIGALVGWLVMAGCADNSMVKEKACVEQASKEVDQLKESVVPLLPQEVGKTAQGSNSCDSGASGALLSFNADRSVSGYQLLQRFRDSGWDIMDMPNDRCAGCVAGVTRTVNARVIEVTVSDRPGASLEIVASYS